MRERLAQLEEKRITIRGTFERFGKKRGWQGREKQTVLLVNITDRAGNVLCDHLWFNLTKAIQTLDLQPGDFVQCDVRVTQYIKGYQGDREDVESWPSRDYKLSHPTHVVKLCSLADHGPLFQREGSIDGE